MKNVLAWIAVAPLLLMLSSPSMANTYPRAAEIKRACAAVFSKDYQETNKRLGWPRARYDKVVDSYIQQGSEWTTEGVRNSARVYGSTHLIGCIMGQMLLHREGQTNVTAPAPLRPTAKLEAHNPANEASLCLELITKSQYKARAASSIMGAVFRNRCDFPVETRWCIGEDRCASGYDNLATMPASKDNGISYDEPPGRVTKTRWAGCRLGFAYRPDFKGTLHYACK